MASVPRFDGQLDRALREEAAIVAESVDEFITRAVVERMLAGMAERGEPEFGPLLEHLAELGIEVAVQIGDDDGGCAALNDPGRLDALWRTGLLDSPWEEAYDRVVGMASTALAVPSAAITLIDDHRQFFKSLTGAPAELVTARETPLDRSVCLYTVTTGEPLIVEDARVHPVLCDHPVVREGFLAAYAGIPLTDHDGYTVGTLCVWDEKPRQWTTGHVQTLVELAGIVQERIFGLPLRNGSI